MKYFIISALALVLPSFNVGSGDTMRITVVDENNAIVEGATVEVFTTHKNYEDEEEVVSQVSEAYDCFSDIHTQIKEMYFK